ncbi:hypothetical protein MCNS_18710 [Mycobacterium conspicuum]|uniref:Uncharacterized protein n=1 Tax=Mycobacterium conspicuum TaxID=44010 RepID=A0A1X1TN76_9MYCO|nr:hypothetical protein AWC00_05735 [Mycobacterium conspicuum]BBZ38808.1 hypothetical protein MCNS_18710 [Mycobacterium conspicuum]
MPVGASVVDHLGQTSFRLLDEAGNQRDCGQVISQPNAAAVGQRGDGVINQVERVLSASRIKGTHEVAPIMIQPEGAGIDP